MRNKLKKYILSAHIVLMVLLFSACNGKSKTSFMQEGGDTLNLRYAENLQIVKYQHYTQVTLIFSSCTADFYRSWAHWIK